MGKYTKEALDFASRVLLSPKRDPLQPKCFVLTKERDRKASDSFVFSLYGLVQSHLHLLTVLPLHSARRRPLASSARSLALTAHLTNINI